MAHLPALFFGTTQPFKDHFYNAVIKKIGHGRKFKGYAIHEAVIEWIEKYVPDYYEEHKESIHQSLTSDYQKINAEMRKKREKIKPKTNPEVQ